MLEALSISLDWPGYLESFLVFAVFVILVDFTSEEVLWWRILVLVGLSYLQGFLTFGLRS